MFGYRFLVLGSGGREHALAWALSKSPKTMQVITAPGNPGTAECGINVPVDLSDPKSIISVAREYDADVVVIGPEQPLVDGIADDLRSLGIAVFGPDKFGAQLEGSKQFAKELMVEFGVPTADYASFQLSQRDEIETYIQQKATLPIVLKADGLAAGKGVFICTSKQEAIQRLDSIYCDANLAKAASTLVIESFLEGEEASVFAVCDGKNYVLLSAAQDHKRIGDGDTGLNTGGMGAYAPAPLVTPYLMEKIESQVVKPMLDGLATKGHPYVGVLYCGLMIKGNAVNVVEFNCRFGDPECQVIVPQIKSDFSELILQAAYGRLDKYDLKLKAGYHCSVVLAADGYPESYPKGDVITGLDSIAHLDTMVFHSGTKKLPNGNIVTNGGRVLNVVGYAEHLDDAINRAYSRVNQIDFKHKYFRKDIGRKGLKSLV